MCTTGKEKLTVILKRERERERERKKGLLNDKTLFNKKFYS